MSKIEMALKKAGEDRGNLRLVPAAAAGGSAAPWTALLGQRVEDSETNSRAGGNESRLLSADELWDRGIIHPQRTDEPAVQVFRELRTKIAQQSREQSVVVLVTAANRGSGASFIARNLGAASAFDSAKTSLLVDCNLGHPSVHQLLADASMPGLADYFENPEIDVSRIIHPVGIPRFRAIPTGGLRDIPEKYFASMKMRDLMDSLRERYRERSIILDGPSIANTTDVGSLSELADCVLMVVRAGHVTNAQIENGLSAISSKKLRIVFNDEPRIPGFR